MTIKKTLTEIVLSAFLLVGCSTIPSPQNKTEIFPEWLYPKIKQDIEYILERGKKDIKLACEVNNNDLYHVHVCLRARSENDKKIKISELDSQNIIFLYHSRELLPNEDFKRNMFHYPDERWDMHKNIVHRGIWPEDVGLKSVTIYFGKTEADLMNNPVDRTTLKKVGGYYFGVSDIFYFLRE
jgi:hypothetical protein